MNLGDEPMNWLGFGLLLFLFVVIALGIHWINLPKLPT